MKNILITLGIGLALSACTGSTAVKTGSAIDETPDWVQSMGYYEKGEGAVASDREGGEVRKPYVYKGLRTVIRSFRKGSFSDVL